MTAAQEDMGQIVDWLSKSSRYYKAPMFGDVAVGPYASILSIDPDTRTMPDLSELAEGGLVFLVPTQQLVKVPVPHLEFQPDGHPPLLERVKHMFSHKLGVELPDVLTLALTAPDVSVNDALFAEGLSDLDLDTVAVLAVPLWAIPAADRGAVAALCRYP